MVDQAAEEAVPVGEVTTLTGLSADTSRFYERQGLIPPVGRTPGGQRRYAQKDLDRLSFLLNLRATGMPIATMRRFAELRQESETARPARLALLLEHRSTVREHVAALRRNLHVIDLKIDRHRRVLRQRGALPVPSTDATTAATVDFALLPIHHVQLAIPRGGEEQCRAFWTGVLGMHELDKLPVLAARGGCWFRGGDLEVHLGVEEPFVPARKAHPGLLVEGLHQLVTRLEQGGHAVTWDGEFPGHDRFYSADPFGNRLEFLQPQTA